MVVYCKTNKIQVICPVCKTRDIVGIPGRELRGNSHLVTFSIQKGLICPHHFQLFIDKNLQIRGYQKVDFELNQDNSIELSNGVKAFNRKEERKDNLFENIILDGNSVKSKSSYHVNSDDDSDSKREIVTKSKVATLKEIYEEFWEFIDEDNEKFQKFIINDKKRKTLSINPNINEYYNHLEIDQEI